MNHVVYCWESGNGLLSLARIAAEMAAQGHRVTCVMREMTRAAELLGPCNVQWLPAPQWKPEASLPAPMDHAEILRHRGYGTPDHLHGLIGAWRKAFDLLRPDRVVCDYAPGAMLAARSLDLPVLCVDNGFSMPPISDPLPRLRDRTPDEAGRPERASEHATLNVINQVMERLRRQPFVRLADIYSNPVWYRNWVEFNHFGKHSADRHVGQVLAESPGVAPKWPSGQGPKVFCYLKGGHPQSMSVLEQAAQLGYRVLAYLPGFSPDVIGKLKSSERIVVSDAPVDLSALEDDIDIGIWHSATEAFARCLDKGMRTLFLPSSAEHSLSCRALQRSGVPVHIAATEENWPRTFAQIQALPRYRLGERFKPADVVLLAQRLAAGDV